MSQNDERNVAELVYNIFWGFCLLVYMKRLATAQSSKNEVRWAECMIFDFGWSRKRGVRMRKVKTENPFGHLQTEQNKCRARQWSVNAKNEGHFFAGCIVASMILLFLHFRFFFYFFLNKFIFIGIGMVCLFVLFNKLFPMVPSNWLWWMCYL